MHGGSSDANALASTEQACRVLFVSSLLTELVSIGSYRTNISMSDFESVKEYSASNNACVKESQETQIGGDGRLLTDRLLSIPSPGARGAGEGFAEGPYKSHRNACPPMAPTP